MIERFSRFWFGPSSGLTLGVARALFFAGLVYQQRHIATASWAGVDPVFFFPTGAFGALGLGVPTEAVLRALTQAFVGALCLSALGLWTRGAMVVAFCVGTLLLAIPHNFGKVHHSDALLVFMLAGLAMSRAGDHFSLDAWLRRRRGGAALPLEHGEYRWPVRYIWLTYLTVYFAAGIAKLRHAGAAFWAPQNMANQMLHHQFTHNPVFDWGRAIAGIPWLCTALALGALVLEIAAPLALLHPRLRVVIVSGLMGMQAGVFLLLGVSFKPFILVIPFFVPWDALAQSLRRATKRA